MQHKFEEVVPGNCVAVIMWLFLFPIKFITILTFARISVSITALGVSVSLDSVVVA